MKLYLIRYSDRSLKYVEAVSCADCVSLLEKREVLDGVISIEVVPANRLE